MQYVCWWALKLVIWRLTLLAVVTSFVELSLCYVQRAEDRLSVFSDTLGSNNVTSSYFGMLWLDSVDSMNVTLYWSGGGVPNNATAL